MTTDNSNSSKPVVALDFDGVFNIFPKDRLLTPPGFTRHEITIYNDDWPQTLFLRPIKGTSETITVTVNPSLHGRWITELREHAEVVWATTWERAANRYIAPLLGIESLPVGISTAEQKPSSAAFQSMMSVVWKQEALRDKYSGRAICWIDDWAPRGAEWRDLHWFINGKHKIEKNEAPTLTIPIDEEIGLTREQMGRVDEWVNEHS